MTALVVDASFAAALLITSQETEASYFALEMPRLLLRQERRTHQRGFAKDRVARLSLLGIALAEPLDAAGRDRALMLALSRNMGLFDAMYLMLAIEAQAVLATRDAGILDAAERSGVAVLDVR